MKMFRTAVSAALLLVLGASGAGAQADEPVLIQESGDGLPGVPAELLDLYRGGVESLKGIESVCVVVLPLEPQVEADGLFRKQINFELTLELVKGGVSLIDPEVAMAEENPVYLFAYVRTLNFDGLNYTYTLGVSLWQGVSLARDPKNLTFASTWRSEELGVVPAGQIRDLSSLFVIKAQEFAADLQAANP